MFIGLPDWLLLSASAIGLALLGYILIRWRRHWRACRPMPFRTMRLRYLRGLVFALALTIFPFLLIPV